MKVLVVDDNRDLLETIAELLQTKSATVLTSTSCEEAVRIARDDPPDVAVLDYRLRDGDAIDLMSRLHAIEPQLPVIILTGHGTIELAVEAMRRGADNFLTKPLDPEALWANLERLHARHRSSRRDLAEATRRHRGAIDPFLGASPAIQELREKSLRIAESDATVLLLGETGAGKGVLARWLHDTGPRAEEPYIDLNCAGLSSELLEAELFGYEKGAFTGAHQRKQGLLEVAHRGTMVLDEIGDLDVKVQPRLLKVLEDKLFRRLGSVAERRVDVRLIASTNQDLRELAQQGRFRTDLLFRINTLTLHLPPLRQRREDIAQLAREILARSPAVANRRISLSEAAAQKLAAYEWPGNIRELHQVLERSALLAGDVDQLGAADLYLEPPVPPNDRLDPNLSLAELEERQIRNVIEASNWNLRQAAERLGLSRSTLYDRLQRYGIERQPPSQAIGRDA